MPVSSSFPAPSAPSVDSLMARMAAGDTDAMFELADHHGGRIAGEVRRQLRVCGVERIAPEDLDGLVLDACMALFDVAGAWRSGGAQPWTWAKDRIRGAVRVWVGVHADSLDNAARGDVADAPPLSTVDEAVEATFARLIEEVPLVGLVAEAAAAAQMPEPALYCLLEYGIQQSTGDPSPAHTLAPRYGVSPQTLRKRVSRDRRRLRAVVSSVPRYAAISTMALVG